MSTFARGDDELQGIKYHWLVLSDSNGQYFAVVYLDNPHRSAIASFPDRPKSDEAAKQLCRRLADDLVRRAQRPSDEQKDS